MSWKTKIRKACKLVGSDGPEYATTTGILIDILERRDEAYKSYVDSGSTPTVIFSNGNPGIEQNLKVWMELNAQALSYARELGITPAGRQKIKESMQQHEDNSLLGLLKRKDNANG